MTLGRRRTWTRSVVARRGRLAWRASATATVAVATRPPAPRSPRPLTSALLAAPEQQPVHLANAGYAEQPASPAQGPELLQGRQIRAQCGLFRAQGDVFRAQLITLALGGRDLALELYHDAVALLEVNGQAAQIGRGATALLARVFR